MFAYCGNCPIINIDENGYCYYDVNLKWRHDSWENSGGYKKKNAPGISHYLFPYTYNIKISNGGSIRFSNGSKINNIEATTKEIYFLTKQQANAAVAVLAAKGAINIIKNVIIQYNKSCKKGMSYVSSKLEKLILKELIKKFGKKAAQAMTSFATVCSIDTSIITDQILIHSQIKRINGFISKGNGIEIYKATYACTSKVALTLQGKSYLSIEKWSSGKTHNPTKGGFYLKKF